MAAIDIALDHEPTPRHQQASQRWRRATIVTGTALALFLAAGCGGSAPDAATSPAPTISIAPTTPPPTPSASANPGAGGSAPDGRISRDQLLKARLDLPRWPGDVCATSQARLAAKGSGSPSNVLLGVEYGDVDRDGATETLVMLRCNLGEPGPAQVVALDRNAAGGIVTLGRVVGTGERGVQTMFAIDPQKNGSVRVQVGDHGGCCNYPADWIQRQWRTYSFGNGQFRQTGGPTSFGPHPQSADLRISVTDVTVVDGSDPTTRRSTVKVTIRNTGPREVDEVHLNLYTVGGSMLDATGTGWSSCTGRDGRGAKDPTCVFGPLRAGQQRTMVLGIGYLKESVGDTAMAIVRRVDHAPDRNENDNFTRFSLR